MSPPASRLSIGGTTFSAKYSPIHLFEAAVADRYASIAPTSRGKRCASAFPPSRSAGGERVRLVADEKPIVDVAHGRPVKTPLGEEFEPSARDGRPVVNAPHIVHADVPFEAWTGEGVGEPAHGVVALEHEDAFVGELREQGRDAQTPDARAHDDGVEVRGDRRVFVGGPRAH